MEKQKDCYTCGLEHKYRVLISVCLAVCVCSDLGS